MTEHTHITTPESLTEDSVSEPTLRPRQLEEFIGQGKVRESLSISIEAAKQRREPLDHILFHGPPGLGKTTLAGLLAREMGVNIKTTSAPYSKNQLTWLVYLQTNGKGTFFSMMRFTGCGPLLMSFCIRRWKIGKLIYASRTGQKLKQ